jgi:hypothetical protein
MTVEKREAETQAQRLGSQNEIGCGGTNLESERTARSD